LLVAYCINSHKKLSLTKTQRHKGFKINREEI
jgi:hypothetical protein